MFEQLLKKEFIKSSLDFFFPPLCLGCGEFTEAEFEICPDCLRKIEPELFAYCLNCTDSSNHADCSNHESKADEISDCCENSFPLYAYSQYLPPLKEIIIQFKFKGIIRPSQLLAQKTVENFKTVFENLEAEYLIPIPLYSIRENVRGYNQASIYAGYLSELLDIKVKEDVIIRSKKRSPQARLKVKDRLNNIKNVFQVIEKTTESVPIILVDDVVTSGSTLKEAKRVLTESGYNVIAAIAIAHAI